jgi:hypothetical protein
MGPRWLFVFRRTVLVVLGFLAGCQSATESLRPANPNTPDGSIPGAIPQGDDSGAMQTTAEPSDAGASGDDETSTSCSDGGLGLPPLVDAAACTPGSLVAAPTATIVTPEQDPSNLALASSPSGDRFLAVWTYGGWTIDTTTVPESIYASLVQPGGDGAANSVPIELTGNGTCAVATWNGTDFTVVWGDSSGLRSQEVDATGALVGTPAQVLSKAGASACPVSLVATPSGLALAWVEGRATYTENAGLIGQGGAIGTPLLLAALGPGVGANAALAQIQSQTYVAFVEWPDASTANTVVSAIDWSQGSLLSQTVEPLFFNSFIAAGDELFLTAGFAASTLYGGVAGTSLQPIGQSCGTWSLTSDGCGRIVQLATQGPTPAGEAVGFSARPLGWSSSVVPLGNVTESAIAGAASTFGVLWYARVGPGIPEFLDAQMSGTLSFTTLSWKAP